jgi:hypothetical protein
VISPPRATSVGALSLARPPLPSLALIATWVAALEWSGPHHGIVLALVPLLLLLASLVAGRYVGERQLTGLRRRFAARRRAQGEESAPARPGGALVRSLGGSVIAWRLAGRAPPAPFA